MTYYQKPIPPTQGYTNAAPVPVGDSKGNLVPINYGQPQPMTQPVTYVQAVPSAVIVNQGQPMITLTANTSSSFATVCPFCKASITTTAIKSFNCCTCLLCYCTGLVFFCCVQLIRGKDVCCYDAQHKCPGCGQIIAVYDSC